MGRRQVLTWVVAMTALLATTARAADATITERPLARLEPATLEEKVTVYLPSGGQLRYVQEARFGLATNWLRAEHEYKHAWSLDRWLAPGKRWPRQRTACVRQQGGKSAAVLDGVPGPAFDSIDPTSLCFSPDGSRLAYTAHQGNRWAGVVVDGKAGPPMKWIEEISFSPDSRHLAYWGNTESGYGFVFDGRLIPGGHALRWSLTGSRYAYVVGEPSRKGRRRGQVMVTDGRRGPVYDRVGAAVFSPDGRRTAYSAEKGGRHFLVTDGRAQLCPGSVGNITFSPDGKTLAYALQVGRESIACLGSRRFGGYQSVGGFLFSPDGSRLVFVGVRNGKALLWVDGKTLPPAEDDSLRWSADSRRLAYVVSTEAGEHVVVDGRPLPGGDLVSPPTFSPDGRQVAYTVIAGSEVQVLRNGERIDSSAYPLDVLENLDLQPSFSPDGRHLAYPRLAGDGPAQLMVDAKAGPLYDTILGWGGRDWREDYHIGNRFIILSSVGLFDTPGQPPRLRWPLWLSSDRLQYLALRAGTIYLVEQRAPGS